MGLSNYPPGVTGNEPHLTGDHETVECPQCGGYGGVAAVCPRCNGDGCRECQNGEREVECPTCEGDGSITPVEPEPEFEPVEERGI